MGVETFENARDYKNWVSVQSNKKIISVLVWDENLVVTWEYI